MSKKYTIRDIAKQAGVSVATVSYVINNRTDQRISEETKKKVLQIVNLLDYRPNSSAKSLATNRTYHIALYLANETSMYKRSEQLAIAEGLAAVLKQHNYHLILQSNQDVEQINYADAILCYDTSNEFFREVGDKNLIPLIAIDCLTDAPLFYQVCTDYARIRDIADSHFGKDNYTYLHHKPNNKEIRSMISDTFKRADFIDEDIYPAIGNIAYSQASLCFLNDARSLYIPCNMQLKMEKVYACLELALNRVPDCEHSIFV